MLNNITPENINEVRCLVFYERMLKICKENLIENEKRSVIHLETITKNYNDLVIRSALEKSAKSIEMYFETTGWNFTLFITDVSLCISYKE